MIKRGVVKVSSLGFTIIESMIAIFVLLIMMTGGMAFYNLATKHTTESAHQKIALEMASSQLESARSTTPVSGWSNVTIGYLPGTMTTTVTPILTYKQVDVEVSWHEPDDDPAVDRKISLNTYVQ